MGLYGYLLYKWVLCVRTYNYIVREHKDIHICLYVKFMYANTKIFIHTCTGSMVISMRFGLYQLYLAKSGGASCLSDCATSEHGERWGAKSFVKSTGMFGGGPQYNLLRVPRCRATAAARVVLPVPPAPCSTRIGPRPGEKSSPMIAACTSVLGM